MKAEKQSIEAIKQRHGDLFRIVVGGALPSPKARLNAFLSQVEDLLQDIKDASSNARSLDEYGFLSGAAVQWQTFYSSTLNEARAIELAPPGPELLTPPPYLESALTKAELEYWIARNADYIAYVRIARVGRASTPTEMESDWHLAKVFLASEILDGKLNFASRISKGFYSMLEDEWLKEVKQLRAYFLWEKRRGGLDPTREKEDYYSVCEGIRDVLGDPGIKAEVEQFAPIKSYVEERYLTDGKVEPTINNVAHGLIAKKARRIFERTGVTDERRNWRRAETYVRMFYENIISAVETNERERVLSVLKAFQYSKARENRLLVINCFEAALAIYFLNAEIVNRLWRESRDKPEPDSNLKSSVAIKGWPRTFVIPKSLLAKFEFDEESIVFRGLMTKAERDLLQTQLTAGDHLTAIEELYAKSRRIHRETTL